MDTLTGGGLAGRPAGRQASPRSVAGLLDYSETRHWAYLLLLPSPLLVVAVAIYPVAYRVWLSFQSYNLLRWPIPRFVGLQQWPDLAGGPRGRHGQGVRHGDEGLTTKRRWREETGTWRY